MSSDNSCEPKVSIIIPVYNVKPYIADALNSVINQTYKNIEIIVVDDGSNDGSEIICDKYAEKDKRIKLIHQKNSGLSAARNTGLNNITGEYVAFLDSDDKLLPEAIEKSIDAALANDVDCVVYQYTNYKVKKNGKINKVSNSKIPVPQGVYSREEALKLVANTRMIIAWNKLSKREVWDNLRFPEGHVYEDLYIIFEMINKLKSIYILNEPLVMYKIREGSINSNHSIQNIKDLLDSWSVFENYVKVNIPEQLLNSRKEILMYLLYRYAKLLSEFFPNKSEVLNLLKEKIINLKKSVDIPNNYMELKIVYFLMLNYSEFISICFPPVFKIYKCFKRICGLVTR